MSSVNRKTFTIIQDSGKEVTLAVKVPEYNDVDDANKVYSTKIATLIRQGSKGKLLVRQELEKFLKDNKVWTDEDEVKVKSLNKEIETLLSSLRKGGLKLSEGRKLAVSVTEKRKELISAMNKRRVFDEVTIESIAENERNDYFVYVCTVYSDSGDKYWESFEDMKNDKLNNVYSKAVSACTEVIYGVDDQFETRLPENRWLKKYGYVDGDLRYVDRKTGEHVDKEGNPISQLQDQFKKDIDNLQGEIVEEVPFIDDEPIVEKEESLVTT